MVMKFTRANIRAERIGLRYRWPLHIGALFGSAFATVGVSVALLHDVQLWHWAAFGGALLVINVGECWLHRFSFHNRIGTRIFKSQLANGLHKWVSDHFYHQHTTTHPAMFDHETMLCDSIRDVRWVLFPWWGFAAVVALLLPIARLLETLEPNLGALFMLATALYYIVYEVLHALSHLLAPLRAVSAHLGHYQTAPRPPRSQGHAVLQLELRDPVVPLDLRHHLPRGTAAVDK